MPYLRQEFRSDPLSYYEELLGHEGENSLLSWLKDEDLAMKISAGAEHELDCQSEMRLVITLTKKGLANTDRVLDAVFTYVQRLKEVGPQEWFFEESKKIGTIAFDYLEKKDPLDYVVDLAREMPHFKNPEDMKHLIRHSHVADVYNQEKLA